MPLGDRTGPEGKGPKTGRGRGYCAGFDNPGFRAFGNRRFGRGFRFGRRFRPLRKTEQYPEEEREVLEEELEAQEREIESLKERIKNLEKK